MQTNRLIALAIASAGLLCADTLYLRDGRTITGTFVSGNSAEITFRPDGAARERYPISTVTNIVFGSGAPQAYNNGGDYNRDNSYRRNDRDDDRDNRYRNEASDNGYASGTRARNADLGRAIPAGTVITVRLIDSINSDKSNVGDTYRASIDDPVVVDGQEIIPRGADATVRVDSVQQGGRITGSEEIRLTLAEIRANGIVFHPATSDAQVASKSRGQQSAKVIGGTAVVGAILGAIAGGGKGAAIGGLAGAGAGTAIQAIRGQRIQIPSESKLDFTLDQPLTY